MKLSMVKIKMIIIVRLVMNLAVISKMLEAKFVLKREVTFN